MKLLGLALGGHIGSFEIMRGLTGEDTKIDIALTNSEVEDFGILGNGIDQTVRNVEQKYLNGDNINEYFQNPLNLPWKDLFSGVLLDSDEDTSYRPDLGKYDFLLVSMVDSFYKPADSLIKYVRENYPELKIVVGGSGVREATLKHIQEIRPDYINMGSCEAFIDYIERGKISNGFYVRKNGSFSGKGNAGSLKITTLEELEKTGFLTKGPVSNIEKDSHSITMMASDDDYTKVNLMGVSSCINACNYCSSPKGLQISPELWIKSIENHKKKYELDGILLQVGDDNPWIHPEKYSPIFKTVLDNFKKVRVEGYIDSLALTQKDSRKMFDMLYSSGKLECGAWFVGRECCDERASRILGRRFKGEIRNQKHLDKERVIIEEVIKESEKLDIFAMMIAYVFGPGEIERSVELRLEEIEQLKNLSDNLEFNKQALKAYPGTRVWKENDLLYEFPGRIITNINDHSLMERNKVLC